MLRHVQRVGPTDLIAGLSVIAVGLFVIYEASAYQFGSVANIGPGYFPAALGVALVLCGLGIIIVEGLRNPSAWPARPAFRAMFAIVAALAAFALIVERFGLAPAVFAAALLASLAEADFRPLGRIVLATLIALFSVIIFVYALGLPITVIKW